MADKMCQACKEAKAVFLVADLDDPLMKCLLLCNQCLNAITSGIDPTEVPAAFKIRLDGR